MNYPAGLLKVVVVALAIPIFGFVVSFIIINDINRGLNAEALPEVTVICDTVRTGKLESEAVSQLSSACQEFFNIELLKLASMVAGSIGILIPTMYWFASVIAGESRKRIAAVFLFILRFSIFLMAASVFLQGIIFTYAVYIGEAYAIGRVHFFLIGPIGLGALVGALSLVSVSMTFGRKLNLSVMGKVLNSSDAPRLFKYVESLSEKLGAKVPDSIIVGLEPTFYVTTSDIQVPGNPMPIKGETLFISAPLARLLSQEEFSSVIGHELGHFRGEDTAYSMRFAPVYAGLEKALGAIAIGKDEGASALARLPAIAMLSYMYGTFASNVAKISRDREHKADQAGAEAGSSLSLSVALIKISLYSSLWDHARNQNVERLNQGKISSNLSVVFQDKAKYDLENENMDNIMRSTLEQTINHPSDTHPPVSKRLDELGVNANQITKYMLLVPENPAVQLIDNYQEIEEEITLLEHKLMMAYGVAQLPKESERNQLVYESVHATYSLAAALISANGRIDPAEIRVAEAIGATLFKDFDSVEFRKFCHAPTQISDAVQFSKILGQTLKDEDKEAFIKYLRAISEADGHVSEDEELLLQKISTGLGMTPSRSAM
ncbi:MAG: M48 family metalloprotease [Nitrospira sp.]|nr:M48 family metalloprotease [Nitrospira sp.]